MIIDSDRTSSWRSCVHVVDELSASNHCGVTTQKLVLALTFCAYFTNPSSPRLPSLTHWASLRLRTPQIIL